MTDLKLTTTNGYELRHREYTRMAQLLRDAGYTVIAPHDKASIRKETEPLVETFLKTKPIQRTKRSYPRAMLKSAEEVLREMGMIK